MHLRDVDAAVIGLKIAHEEVIIKEAVKRKDVFLAIYIWNPLHRLSFIREASRIENEGLKYLSYLSYCKSFFSKD